MVIVQVSLIIVQFNTILIKKVQKLVWSHYCLDYTCNLSCQDKQCDAISFLFISISIITDDITFVMNLYWIDSLFTASLGLKPSVSGSSAKQARYCCFFLLQ